MTKVAIVTDSNSGITQDRGRELGIYVLPMPFFIDGELFLEDITLTQEQFYEKLGADSDISTSQPSPGNVMELWEKVLKEYDEIVCIPMSSGLSSTCFTAMSIAAEYKGRGGAGRRNSGGSGGGAGGGTAFFRNERGTVYSVSESGGADAAKRRLVRRGPVPPGAV